MINVLSLSTIKYLSSWVQNHVEILSTFRGHSRLGYYFWDKGIKDYVALDLGVYYDLLLFDQ